MKKVENLWKRYYDYIIIAVLYGLLHVFMNTDSWDDKINTQVLKDWGGHLFAYLRLRWQTWSSTLILEGVEAIIGFLPGYVWKIIDVIMIEIIYHYLNRIVKCLTARCDKIENYRLWSLLFFLNFPYVLLGTAGWLTTTIAYTWVLAMYFYSISVFLSCAQPDGCKVKPRIYAFFGLAVIFAANLNLVAFQLFMIFLIIYFLCKEKSHSLNILFIEGMLASLLNIILFVCSPGHRVRNIEDARYHGTDALLHMTVGGHLRMGINTAFYHFVSVPNVILLTCCLAILVCVLFKTRNLSLRVLSGVPLSIDIFWTGYMFIMYTVPNGMLTYIYPDAQYYECSKQEQYCVMVSAILMVLVMCYLLAYLTDFSYLSCLVISVFILGLFPSVAIGFTTTVSASIMRVASFFYFSIMLCTQIIIARHDILKNKGWKCLFYILGGGGTVLNVLQIIRHIIIYG